MKTLPLLLLLLFLPTAMALNANNYQVVLGVGDRETLSDDFSAVETVSDNVPVLVIGGPCATDLWERYADMACSEWPFEEGDGMVLSRDNGRVILIGGTTQADTERLLTEFLDNSITSEVQQLSDTGDEFTITEGQSRTIETNDGSVRVSGVRIEGNFVDITVDGDSYDNIGQGRTIVTDDDELIEILTVGTTSVTIRFTAFDDSNDEDEVTVEEGDTETVNIDGDTIEIEDVSIDDDTVDVTIDGKDFNNLEDGDEGTVGNVEFEITDISDDSVTIAFEEMDELSEGDDITLNEGDDLDVDVEGESLSFDDVAMGNNMLNVTVEGSSYTNLIVGNTIDAGDVTLSVRSISEDEAELNIDDVDD